MGTIISIIYSKTINFCVLIILVFVFSFHVFPQGGAAINTTGAAADPSAILDISGNSQGVLINRLTSVERNAISSPAIGLLIFNLDCKQFQFWDGTQWVDMMNNPAGSPPVAPVTNAGSGATYSQITANWNSSTGATYYLLDVATDISFTSFVPGFQNINVGLTTSYDVPGLSCGTNYFYRVRAANNCGTSTNSGTITYGTAACWTCGNSLIVSHTAGSVAPVNKTVTYGTVSTSLTGATKCWITQNLGADNQGASASDATEAAAGWYWQFNRTQGFKHDGSIRTPSTLWITTINENSNWISANDPCTMLLGSNWRIPTYTEWATADAGWSTFVDTYGSVLKIHAGGRLDPSGNLQNRGNQGRLWTSTQGASNNDGWYFYYNTSESDLYGSNGKTSGFSLRCLKD